MDDFYDEVEGMFKVNEDSAIAHLLGEEIENPKETFRKVEEIFDERINLLSKALYNTKKFSDSHIEEYGNLANDIAANFDTIENDLYYRIKNLFSDFQKKNDELNSQNLLLQKYLTQLTKEKMDLLVQIGLCMNKLDQLENYLGINIAAKRTKKAMTKK